MRKALVPEHPLHIFIVSILLRASHQKQSVNLRRIVRKHKPKHEDKTHKMHWNTKTHSHTAEKKKTHKDPDEQSVAHPNRKIVLYCTPRMRMRMKMSRTARIDDKQICLSCETCIFITFVHRVQSLHNVWVLRLVHFVNIVQHTMHLVQCTMHYTLWTRHYALDALRTVHYALCTWCTSYNALCTMYLMHFIQCSRCTCVQIGTSANGAWQVRGMWLWTQLLEYELSWTLQEYESMWTLVEQTLTKRADISYMLVST